jgi:hypothetical membrane protein
MLLLWSLGVLGVLSSTAAIWLIRIVHEGHVYVSGLGADGAPESAAFNTALLSLGISGVLLSLVVQARADWRHRRLGATVWALLFVAGLCFAVASRIPCSAGCPIPGTASFGAQDAIHLSAAILGFVLVCLAMLVVGIAATRASVRLSGVLGCVLVTVFSSAGGLLALARSASSAGAWLEFIAMTVGVCWLVVVTSLLMGFSPSQAPRASAAAPDAGRAGVDAPAAHAQPKARSSPVSSWQPT